MAMEYVHIWLGDFSSNETFKKYFEEHYDEDADEQPINQFASDQGENFYDHDWVESSFTETGTSEELLKRHSYSSTYAQEVLEKAKKLGIKTINTFIMAGSEEFSAPQSIQTANYSLHYLGLFKAYIKP